MSPVDDSNGGSNGDADVGPMFNCQHNECDEDSSYSIHSNSCFNESCGVVDVENDAASSIVGVGGQLRMLPPARASMHMPPTSVLREASAFATASKGGVILQDINNKMGADNAPYAHGRPKYTAAMPLTTAAGFALYSRAKQAEASQRPGYARHLVAATAWATTCEMVVDDLIADAIATLTLKIKSNAAQHASRVGAGGAAARSSTQHARVTQNSSKRGRPAPATKEASRHVRRPYKKVKKVMDGADLGPAPAPTLTPASPGTEMALTCKEPVTPAVITSLSTNGESPLVGLMAMMNEDEGASEQRRRRRQQQRSLSSVTTSTSTPTLSSTNAGSGFQAESTSKKTTAPTVRKGARYRTMSSTLPPTSSDSEAEAEAEANILANSSPTPTAPQPAAKKPKKQKIKARSTWQASSSAANGIQSPSDKSEKVVLKKKAHGKAPARTLTFNTIKDCLASGILGKGYGVEGASSLYCRFQDGKETASGWTCHLDFDLDSCSDQELSPMQGHSESHCNRYGEIERFEKAPSADVTYTSAYLKAVACANIVAKNNSEQSARLSAAATAMIAQDT